MRSVCRTFPMPTRQRRRLIACSSPAAGSPTLPGAIRRSASASRWSMTPFAPMASIDVGLPPGPNFFRYGDPGYARELLGGAGFADVSIKEVPLVWRAASPDTVVEGLARGTVRAAAVIKRQSPENLVRIKQHMRDRVAQFRQADGGYAVPSRCPGRGGPQARLTQLTPAGGPRPSPPWPTCRCPWRSSRPSRRASPGSARRRRRRSA